MDENPKTIWTRPWRGSRAALAVLSLVFGVTFAAVLGIEHVTSPSMPGIQVVRSALLIAVLVVVATVVITLHYRWLKRGKNFRRFLFVVACLFTAIVLLLTEENWRGRHDWEAYKHQQEAKGESFSLESLAPAPVPDDQNFALSPLFKPLFDFERTPNGTRWNDTNGYNHLLQINPIAEMKGKLAPPMGAVSTTAFIDLEKARDFYSGNTNYPQPLVSGGAAEDILVALGRFNADVEELRQDAAARPESRFPVHYGDEPASGILLPHLACIKRLAMIVNLRSVCELELHENAAAFADLKLGLRLSESVSNDPFLIDELVRAATLSMCLQTLREGIERHAWTDAQLAELQNDLGTVNLLAEMKLTFKGEQALGVDTLDNLRRGTMDTGYFSSDQRSAGRIPGRSLMGGFFYQNMLANTRLYNDYTFPAFDESARRVFPDVMNRFRGQIDNQSHHPWRHPYSILADLLYPAIDNALIKIARTQSWVDEANVACALERYYLVNKSYPDSLSPLVPSFINHIPHDIIDGQPLRYHQRNDGSYVIYSIGWNQKDDGGALAYKSQHEVDATQGDWLWSSSSL